MSPRCGFMSCPSLRGIGGGNKRAGVKGRSTLTGARQGGSNKSTVMNVEGKMLFASPALRNGFVDFFYFSEDPCSSVISGAIGSAISSVVTHALLRAPKLKF